MYTEGAQTTGHHRFLLQHVNASSSSSSSSPATSASCQHCVHHHGHRGGYRPAPHRQTDHPSSLLAPRVKDPFAAGHRSPQRRPVFAGPGDDSGQVCPWELNPAAQWSRPPPEPGLRHCPSVREQCGCVVHAGDVRAHPFAAPHPLPHLQVKGQGYRYRRTVRYVSVDEEGEGCGYPVEGYQLESHHVPNGHGGPRPLVYFEGGEERDSHQDRGRLKGGSEDVCNGRVSSHKAFFPTEVPQRHLNQSRQKGLTRCVAPPPRPGPVENDEDEDDDRQRRRRPRRHQSSEVAKQKTRQDLVRDQIRQVVTDLEDVLGGLKQVHVEMKQVVEQIDRLTAGIDLTEEAPSIALGSSAIVHGPLHPGDLRLAPLPEHKPAPHHVDEDRIILRTNSPSPVHMASVVKTSRFTPPSANHEKKPGANGHPPHMHPPTRGSNHVGHAEPHPPQSLDPKVIIGNSTQKPPLYPQNGRCGKYPSAKPARTPAYPGRGRQNASMV